MKKLFLAIGMIFLSSIMFAQQKVEYFRYVLCLNVASAAKDDLEGLISKGYKIIGFSLDYQQKTMIVVYDDKE